MKCPTCQALMCPLDCPHGPDSGYHWCGTCGCVIGPLNNPTYPAQAKSHAALREALKAIASESCQKYLTDNDLLAGDGLCQINGATDPCLPCVAFAALALDEGK